MFDENDGLFDHMVPPTPPQSRAEGLSTIDTTNEVFTGNAQFAAGPYGMGVRVPMIVISPWSKGGWVASEVFDHTSLIQFVEQRFGPGDPALRENNITPWRRAVAGDLTSAFNFKSPSDQSVPLPSTAAFVPPDSDRHPDYKPVPPTQQAVPRQEPGVRPARAVPYVLHATAKADVAGRSVDIHFANAGQAAAVFQVRSGNDQRGPWTYTVGAKDDVSDTFGFAASPGAAYDLTVHGPNGFMRAFKGSVADRNQTNLTVRTDYDPGSNAVTLQLHNRGERVSDLQIVDAYSKDRVVHRLQAGDTASRRFSLDGSFGWYDLTLSVPADPGFQQRFAGHVETGKDSVSDPALGG
jgi:phospholipase C